MLIQSYNMALGGGEEEEEFIYFIFFPYLLGPETLCWVGNIHFLMFDLAPVQVCLIKGN